jgi:hypothetical protein
MPIDLNPDRLLDEREAAQILCCSVALLRKMRLFATGPSYCKIGRLVRTPSATSPPTSIAAAIREPSRGSNDRGKASG